MKDYLFKINLLKRLNKFFVSNQKNIVLFCLPFIIIQATGIVYFATILLNDEAKKVALYPLDQTEVVADYPQVIRPGIPDLTAQAAIIIDRDSQVPVFKKNSSLRFSVASTTKIMTALVGLEYFKLSDVLTVMRDGVEGAQLGLYKDDRVTFETLLYGMMLPSGNDAAYAVADNYPGGVEKFVEKMNEKAKALHLSYTHYADPAGLLDDEDYSTAEDLARLGSVAITHPVLKNIVKTKEKVLTIQSTGRQISVKNLNILLGSDGVVGLKTGYTTGAGGVLITVREEKGKQLVFVVMKSEDRFYDTKLLLSFIKGNVTYFKPLGE